MPSGTRCVNSPRGPLTFTMLLSTVTVTPLGIVTGILPIRDMASLLPDDGDELAAGARLSRLAVGHQALVGAHDREAKAVANARDLADGDVFPKAGGRHALELADNGLAAGVLEPHAQHGPALVGLQGRVILN